ncbi:MAG: hypothetical protein Q8R88_00170 [Desulfoprunum sp.]|nr:hypothetical protein [Desulfoprunum sp.]
METQYKEYSQIDFHCGLAAITVAQQELSQKQKEIKRETSLNGPDSMALSTMLEEAAILLTNLVDARVFLLKLTGDWPRDQYD